MFLNVSDWTSTISWRPWQPTVLAPIRSSLQVRPVSQIRTCAERTQINTVSLFSLFYLEIWNDIVLFIVWIALFLFVILLKILNVIQLVIVYFIFDTLFEIWNESKIQTCLERIQNSTVLIQSFDTKFWYTVLIQSFDTFVYLKFKMTNKSNSP